MTPMFSLPRTGRFIVIFSVIVMATIVVMTVLLLWQLRVQDLQRAEGETVILSHIVAEQTTRSLQGVGLAIDLSIDRLAEAKRLGVALNEFAIHAMLRSRVEGMPQLRSMFIVDASGKIASSALSHPAPRLSVKDRDYFTAQRDRTDLELYVGAPLINRVDGKMTFFFSRRIPNARGEFSGVVVASLDLVYMESLYEATSRTGVRPISLFLEDGTLIVRAPTDKSRIGHKGLLPTIEPGEKSPAWFKTVRTAGEGAGVSTYSKIGGFPMFLSVGNSDHDALAEWRDTARMVTAAALVNILLVLIAAVFLLRRQGREEALASVAQESDQRLRAMVDSAMDAIITVDSERRIVVFNPAAQSLFGYSLDEVLGSPLERLLPERFRTAHEGNVAAFRESSVTARMKQSHMEVIGRRADGSEFPIESTIAQVTIGGQTLLTAILRDISGRRRAEDELSELNVQLRDLAASLQAVREQERTAIARELHDELGQQLLRLRMDLDWLAGRLKDLAPVLHEKTLGMKEFVVGTVDALRHVTTQLRPPLLDELGLAEAARWQLSEFARRTGIEVDSNIFIDDMELDERIAINVFRILQESLTNVARHAAATRVEVSLERVEQGLVIEISDNGCGTAQRDKPGLGHGLVGIRERTLMLDGQMEIVSAPGDGFALRVRIPLPKTESTGEQE
jgi:PAS domain S-box-containing protein